jgi:hypothetical protein
MDEIGNNPSSKRSNYSSEIRISNTKETIQKMKKVSEDTPETSVAEIYPTCKKLPVAAMLVNNEL